MLAGNFGLNAYLPAGTLVSALIQFHGSIYVWVFNGANGMARAQHLIGCLQHAVNGIRFFVFNTNAPAAYC